MSSAETTNPNAPVSLIEQWDKTFPESAKVDHRKVTFQNRYGITLVGDLYLPKDRGERKLAAIAVSGPFGAVKEQSSGLYAQTLAEQGFVTLAFDPSYTGESGGYPRNVASPDINTEDFSAAVDYLGLQKEVDRERIGIIGICGWGGMAVNAAAIDTRIKATAAMTMYDMTRVTANGYFDAEDSEQARFEKKKAMNAQRTEDYKNGSYALAGGVVDPLPEDAPQFVKDYYAYYKTPRGYHPRSLNSNNGWNVNSIIDQEYLKGRERFRYKKAVILMGANATGKTSLGKALLRIFGYMTDGNPTPLYEMVAGDKGYFSIDFVNGDYRLQRLSAQIDASNQEIDIQYQTADIDTMDSYEKCVKKH